MYKTLVIPVSFEEGRDTSGAIEFAQRVATPDASITFLHVIQSLPVYATEYVPAEVLTNQRKDLQDRLDKLAATVPNSRTATVEGSAGRGITDWAEDNAADCIVIASHQPVMSDILIGSTAAWVVRHAHCAVHVLR